MTDVAKELSLLLLKQPTNLPVNMVMGVVSNVTPQRTLEIYLSGGTYPVGGVRYLDSYKPQVNDTVIILKHGPDMLVVGRAEPKLSPLEAVHTVGVAGEPAFENGWTNFGGGFEGARFWKDPEGVVHVEGLIKSGTVTSTMFTLPVGYRPATNKRYMTLANGVVTCVQIFPDGVIRQTATGSTSNAWVNLNGISFVAEDAIGSPPFVLDKQLAGGPPLVALDTEAPDWPGCFRRSDGWWLYKGYLAGSAASGALRIMPEDTQPEWHALFRAHALTAATTGHIGKRLDISTRSGGYLESPEATGVRMSLDQVRWWEHQQRSGWTNLPTLQNSWSNYSTTPYWGPGQYRKDKYGMVHLRGLLAPGSTALNTIITTLPAGFRPATRRMFAIASSNGTARMDVHDNGNVVVASGGDGYGATYASLDQIRFLAEA